VENKISELSNALAVDTTYLKKVVGSFVVSIIILHIVCIYKCKNDKMYLNRFKNLKDKIFLLKLTGTLVQGKTGDIRFNEIEDLDDNGNDEYKDTLTLITSSNSTRCSDITPSFSVGAATNIQQALAATRFKLKLDVLSNNTVSATLSYDPFFGKPICNSPTRFSTLDGLWVIKRANHTVHYTDGKAFAQPISIEAGLIGQPGLSHQTIPNTDDSSTNNPESGNVTIEADLPSRYGISYDQVPDGFARWVDI
jgi:hypothetical protein